MWRRMRRSVRTMGADQRGGLLEAVIGYGMIVAAITSAATTLPPLAKTVGSILAHDRGYAIVANSVDHFNHDCRSARACDVPATDVAGADNSDGHAWAALFQAADGSYKALEYVWDSAAHTLQAYVGPPDALLPYGPPLTDVRYFQAREYAASDVADSSSPVYLPIITVTPQNVNVPTQFSGFVGGNHFVRIRIANGDGDLSIDVMPGGAADTGLTTISGTYTPPPPSSCSFVSSYAGSSSTGWTPQTSTSLWQWYQTPAPCTPAPTPPPVAYVADYAPNCDTTFYRAENGNADWTQQPRADATTPPPTHALVGYDANGSAIYQDFAWNQGPCPHPTPPAQDPNPTPTPAPTPTPGGSVDPNMCQDLVNYVKANDFPSSPATIDGYTYTLSNYFYAQRPSGVPGVLNDDTSWDFTPLGYSYGAPYSVTVDSFHTYEPADQTRVSCVPVP